MGGPIALVREGDSITIDAKQRLLQLNVPAAEIEKRAEAFACRGAEIGKARAADDREPGRRSFAIDQGFRNTGHRSVG